MDSPEREAAIRAVTAVLEGIVPLCVEHGITSPEVESLLRSVYVHAVAATTEKIHDRPNAAAIAMRSGIHRNYVNPILKAPPQISNRSRYTRRHRVNRVLDGWHSDPDFVDESGQPAWLALEEEGGSRKTPSFSSLVEAYAPSVRASRMLRELERVNAVEIVQSRARPLLRQYKAAAFSEEGLQDMARKVNDLVATTMKNLTQTEWPHVCDTVETIDIDPERMVSARNIVRELTQNFSASLKEELNSRRIRWKTGTKGPRVRFGVTFFSHTAPVVEGTDGEE